MQLLVTDAASNLLPMLPCFEHMFAPLDFSNLQHMDPRRSRAYPCLLQIGNARLQAAGWRSR